MASAALGAAPLPGLVRITGRAPDRLRFELGLRDGEPPLMVYKSGDRLVR